MNRNDPIYCIMDVDWAHDDVLREALGIFAAADVPVTVFVTHDTPVLDEMRDDPLVELGIHPNFNDLLNGTARKGDSAASRVEALRRVVPEANVVRNHSMCQTSYLMNLFADIGFTHEVNTLIMAHSGIALSAWRHWSGDMTRVPTVFEDSLAGHLADGWDPARVLSHPGLRVLNFHPVRLVLNACEPNLPGPSESVTWSPAALADRVRPAHEPGSRSFLEALITGHRARGGSFGLIGDIEA